MELKLDDDGNTAWKESTPDNSGRVPLVTALRGELEVLEERFKLQIEQTIRQLEDAKGRSVSTHLGHNVGAAAHELSAQAGRISSIKAVLEHVESEQTK